MDDDASPSADTVQPAQEQVELLAEGTVVPAAAAAAVPRPVMVHVPPGSRLIRVPHGETAPSYIDTLFELQGECKGADAEYSYFVVPDCDVDAYASDRCAFDYDSAIPRDANDAAAATLSRGISYYHRSAWYLEPPEIVTVLKPYQTEGRQFLMDRSGAREVMPDGYRMNPHGAILADRMGLGKTLQVLAAIVDTIGAYMSQCADTTQQALATLSHADAAAAAVTTTTAAAPSTSSSSSMAVPMSSLYMRSRAFYRGPPSLVVAPPNAIQAWATEVRRHTRGLAVAQIERDNTLWVFTHPERPELNIDGAAPMRVEGILELSDLLSYDILFVTYNRIMLSAPSALMQLLQDFNPLVPQKTTATRLALQQSQRYSAANWDDMCRPQRPVLYNRPNELGTACLWVLSLSWLVADEAHVLGNPKNKRTQAMWTLYANNYAMVTATPTSNHLGELAPLMLLIRAQNLPEVANWERVRRNQVKARKVDDIPAAAASAAQSGAPVLYLGGDPNNAAVTFELTDQTVSRLESVGAHDLALIQAAIIHNALARTEEQAGLRQQFTVHRWVIKYPFVNVAERLLNRLTLAQAQEWFKRLELDEVDGRQIYHRVLPLFTRAKQIAIAANTVIRTRLNRGGAAANSIAPHVQRFFELPEFGLSATKLQLLFALLADESRIARTEKVIICCSFRSVLELIAERFKQTKVGHALITGAEYDRQRRADTIRRFQTDPTVRFALVTLRVAQSIDLTAACHVSNCVLCFSQRRARHLSRVPFPRRGKTCRAAALWASL